MLRHNDRASEIQPAPHWWGQWPSWAGYAAAVWSLAYAMLGLYWTLGGPGFPFGENDPASHFSAFAGADAAIGAPAITMLGLLGAVAAVATRHVRSRGVGRLILLGFCWIVAAILLFVVPDARALVALAYAPVVLLGAPFGWPPGDYRDAVPWPVVNQFVCLGGGFLWAMTALALQCDAAQPESSESTADRSDWMSPSAAAQWGTCATYVAAIVPLVYAATRWAWALGIPLGLDARLLLLAQTVGGGAWAGAVLGTVAVCGSILTLGLVQEWGERFPRWLPFVAGRPVPPALAIVPAIVVAVLVTAAGLMMWRRMLLGTGAFTLFDSNWAALAPELLWPIWGIALGAAALAYAVRRRGTVA